MTSLAIKVLLVSLSLGVTHAVLLTCHQCSGINCQRENYAKIEQCTSELDICASIFHEQRLVAQGCYEHIPAELREGCEMVESTAEGNNVECHLCKEKNCNTLGPASLKCIQCDSRTNEACHSDTDKIEPTRCTISRSLNAYCYTNHKSNHVERGCALTPKQQRECHDRLDCTLCLPFVFGPCNGIPKQSNNGTDDNNPDHVSQKALGRFNDLPLNCYSCTGADCITNGIGRIGKCAGSVDQACATVFAADGSVTARGCSDAVAELCTSNTCRYCQSSGCNEATSLNQYVECIACDTATDKNCLYNVNAITTTSQCLGGCITALYPNNKTDTDPAYDLARTCLDDLDLDERESCENGNKENCVACTTGKCNTATVPSTPRLKCYICEEDCADFEELECPAYRANDQCFAMYDDDNNLVQLGCRSSLGRKFEMENKRSIYFCTGDSCNLKTPAQTTCAACDTTTNTACTKNPALVPSKTCSRFPNTQCATYIDAIGNVARDCVYDVPGDDLYDKCLSSDNEQCVVCDSNNCNKEIFPADRLSCLQCDSSTDPSCEQGATSSAAYCLAYTVNDKCVTLVDNGITRRGCRSQLICDASDSENCRVCSGANCNTINLIKNQVGEPGRWQDLPLSCYTCTGAECLTGTGSSQVCADNNVQNCMTVFAADGTVTARGCSDAVMLANRDYCEASDNNCFTCKSNNCNNALQKSEYIECYFCDSAVSDSCVSDSFTGRTRQCKGACMVALYAATSAEDPAYELVRSCLDDKELADQTSCSSGSDANCRACTTNNCNTQLLPEDRLSCFKCDDDECQTQSSQVCRSYQADDQCYITYNATITDVISMGCRSELPADTVETLTKDKNFWICNGNNCNNLATLPTPKSCLVCDSLTDKNCIANPSVLTTYETCAEVPYVECMSRVRSDGVTERGCLNSLEDDTFYNCLKGEDNLCSVCMGENCNAVSVFPADRLRCQQCNGEKDANCGTSPNNLDVCDLYVKDDTCVTTIQNTYTLRGCASSLKCEDPKDTSACRTCSTAGCNTVNLEQNYLQGAPGRWQSVPISCLTCSDQASCATTTNAVQCTNNVNQQCYTVFNENNQVIQRGCKDDVLAAQQSYCDANSGRCIGCNSNSCNNVINYSDYIDCLFCDTERNGKCVNSVAGITTTRKCNKQCVTALYPRSSDNDTAYGLSRSCLDDLEVADQNACIAGTKENCVACSTANCNAVALPATRLNCFYYQGDSYASPVEQQCAQYRENDMCYTQYDENGQKSRLGCLSDFTHEMAEFLISEQLLITCEGANCNRFDYVPPSHTCTLCNSRTDPDCATNPEAVTSSTECAKVPYTSCYSRVLSDGATERGCLSSLQETEFLQCLNGDAEYCEICSEEGCNNKLYPIPRLSCHVCNSEDVPNCARNPNSLMICPKFSAQQQCVSSYSNGVTYRGCSSDLQCDTTNSCETCSGDGCNTLDVAKASDKNFGKWQDLPLTCLTCSGAACLSGSSAEQQCANNNEQDCLTVFDDSGVVVRRGCSEEVAADATYGAWCSQNPEKCYNCKSNKCNTATRESQFTRCVYCDSNINPNCLYDVSTIRERRQCQAGCMTALYAANTAENPSYEIIRTCLNDKETRDQSVCSLGSDKLCKSCVSEDCNVDVVPQTRLSCYQCVGEDCADPVSKICPLYKENDQCFTLFDESNSVAEQGCASSFMALSAEEILATRRIQLCNGENCNTFDKIPQPQQCVSCDSNDDPNCATNAYLVSTLKTCTALPYTSCYSALEADGATSRGCVSDLADSEFTSCLLGTNDKCKVCEGDGCNRELFPEDRLQCYSCNSNEDANCETSPTDLQYCARLTDNTACATALMGGNVTVRGCNDDVLCDANDPSTCQLCKTSACNNKNIREEENGQYGLWQDLPLTCYTCEGEQCLSSLGVSQTCEGSLYQDCVTVFNSEGNVTRRGCSYAVEAALGQYCSENNGRCFYCKSNECNLAWSKQDYVECVYCNSDDDARCDTLPMNVEFPSRYCYKSCMVAQKGSTIIRSCLDDKEVFDQNNCSSTNHDDCASCQGQYCNQFVFPRPQLSCHVCSNAACTTSVSKECEYSTDDNNFCIAQYEANRLQLLGCASDQLQSDLEQWSEEEKLYSCWENDCNAVNLLPQPITCISCNASSLCAQAPEQVTGRTTCNVIIPECYSLVSTDGTTARGCVSDLQFEEEYSCTEDGRCSTCKTQNCNSQVYPEDRRRCYVCSSATDSKCENQLSSSSFSKVCELYDRNDVCVTTYVDGHIERGCSSSLKCDINNPKNCVQCDGNNCNTDELEENCEDKPNTSTVRPPTTASPDSGAAVLAGIPALLLACIIALVFNRF